ncbi:glycosyltransferase family 9 protein [Candidatus Poribacteria bacterium]|nr:glycosyltransferase family 9 protein [Candidatus Poribacteria bacterium]
MQSNRFHKFLDRYVGIPIGIILFIISRFYYFFAKCIKLKTRRTRDKELSIPPKRILFIQLSALGDTILAIPTVRAFRQEFPDTEISFLASPTNLSYLEHCPYIDKHILFNKPSFKLIFGLRQERFDYIIDLEHWSRFSMLLAYFIGASRIIGFSAAGQHRHYLFTDSIPHVPGKHEVLNFLSITDKFCDKIEDISLEVWIEDSELQWCHNVFVEEELQKDQRIVILHPEAGRRGEPRRRWIQENFIELADIITEKYGVQVVLTGAPDEVQLSQTIETQTVCKTINLAGKTKVNQLAALFNQADLVISGNCGPMHLAAATGTPVIAIHGPTNSEQWGPWGENNICLEATLPCSPCLNLGFEYACQALPDGTSPCMHTISVSEVLQACDRYLG